MISVSQKTLRQVSLSLHQLFALNPSLYCLQLQLQSHDTLSLQSHDASSLQSLTQTAGLSHLFSQSWNSVPNYNVSQEQLNNLTQCLQALSSFISAHKPKTASINKFNSHSKKIKIFLADLCTQFMLQLQTHVTDFIKVLIAISHLNESAQVWLQFILKEYQNNLIENYTLFTQELQEQFEDFNLHDILTEKLHHLHQIISVLIFINNFKHLAYQIQI